MIDYMGLLLDMSLETDDLLATMDLDTLIEKENTIAIVIASPG